MTSTVNVRNPEAITRAVGLLRRGEVVAVPTDTVYGLAADAFDPQAVQRLFDLKDRPAQRSIAVIVADADEAARLVELSPSARRLADEFWPGPLTLVARRAPGTPEHLGAGDTIGVRVPDHDPMRNMARPGALAVTSANMHGEPTPATAVEVARLFGAVPLVLDGGPLPGQASTVVDVTTSPPVVLREGPISAARIAATVGHLDPEDSR